MRRSITLLLLLSLAIGAPRGVAAASGSFADVQLTDASAHATVTGDQAWSLSKTGSVSGNTVTWHITATNTATVSGQLVVQGEMTVTNTGTGPATIGNIVVNLQARRGNRWTTKSSDVADATHGDDATTATIQARASSENLSSFTENAASGHLELRHATNDTVFSLVPEKLIGPGETVSLLFQASFDNNVLGIAAGTPIRSETIVSFGNATKNGNSAANVDINGNGTIDNDEHRIRSVPSRLGLTVPPQTNGNTAPTLSDTSDDIVGVGVTVSNVQVNLGATSGTVTATVSGSGTVTNCAHLTSDDVWVTSGGFTFLQLAGLDLEACDTEDVDDGGPPPACTPGTTNCPWNTGALTTYTQNEDGWGGATSTAGGLLLMYFQTFYGGPGGVTIGSIYKVTFESASAVFNYLPQSGNNGQFTSSMTNPTDTSAGALGGSVLALTLNVRFSDAGASPHTSSTALGDLNICGLLTLPDQSVRQFLANANTVVGGGTVSGLSSDFADNVAGALNNAFVGGAPNTFAQTYLVKGPCP